MKFRAKKHKGVLYYLMLLLIIFMFITAVTNILLWQTNKANIWHNLYNYTRYILFMLEMITILILGIKKVDRVTTAILIYCLWEVLSLMFIRNTGIGAVIKDGLVWPLMFLSTYLYVKKYEIDPIWKNLVLVFSCLCMLLLIKNIQLHLSGFRLYGGVVGPVYYCIPFLGIILLLHDTKIKIVFSILMTGMLVISTKRAGTIAMLVGLPLYYFIYAKIQNKQSERLPKYIMLFSGVGIGALMLHWYLNSHSLAVIDRLLNVVDDQGSGRIMIWTKVISGVANSSTIRKIIGHGFHSVPLDIYMSAINNNIMAHNSYLEALYDYGIIGVCALFVIVIFLVWFLAHSIKEKKWYAPTMGYVMVITIMLSMFGYYFEESRFILPVAFQFGIMFGLDRKSKKRLSVPEIRR